MPNSNASWRASIRLPDPRDVAWELARRAARQPSHVFTRNGERGCPYVVRVSDPPTRLEHLQLAIARKLGQPVAIMPHPCATADEWIARYARAPGSPELDPVCFDATRTWTCCI